MKCIGIISRSPREGRPIPLYVDDDITDEEIVKLCKDILDILPIVPPHPVIEYPEFIESSDHGDG